MIFNILKYVTRFIFGTVVTVFALMFVIFAVVCTVVISIAVSIYELVATVCGYLKNNKWI
jgi:hypothetical protein